MRYFILNNEKASIFYCSASKLMVTTHKAEEAVGVEKVSKKIMEAVKGGGLREVFPEELEAAKKKAASKAKGKTSGKDKEDTTDPGAKLKAMDDKQLIAYYKENFTVSKEDLEAFSKMNTEEKIQFLLEDEED